jgi:acetyl esterase/lipase
MTRLVLSVVLASMLASCGRGKGPGTPNTATGAANQPAAAKSDEHPPPPPPLPVPASVVVKEAIPYADGPGADPARNLLDLYLPKDKTGFSSVVFIHGGGYQRGDRSLGHNLGVVMANHGVAVASISYRLYPQVKHPGQIQDVAKAFAWVKSHIADHGGDPARVHVSGHSAGGHLAALLGTDGSYLAAEHLKPADIASVLAISGGYRINPIRKDVFGDDAAMADASPFAHITGNHPPFVLLYGSLEKPDRHELSREFRDALLGAHGQAVCVMIPDRDHQALLDKIAEDDPTALALLHAVENSGR